MKCAQPTGTRRTTRPPWFPIQLARRITSRALTKRLNGSSRPSKIWKISHESSFSIRISNNLHISNWRSHQYFTKQANKQTNKIMMKIIKHLWIEAKLLFLIWIWSWIREFCNRHYRPDNSWNCFFRSWLLWEQKLTSVCRFIGMCSLWSIELNKCRCSFFGTVASTDHWPRFCIKFKYFLNFLNRSMHLWVRRNVNTLSRLADPLRLA